MLNTRFSENHFSEFLIRPFSLLDHWAHLEMTRNFRPKMEMEIDAEKAEDVVDLTAVPTVIVHEAKLPKPKQRGGASHMGIDKAFDKRTRVSEEQKAKAVEHYLKKPSMTYEQLGDWCKDEFKLDKAPSKAAVCAWLKPDKRKQLIEMLAIETSAARLAAKCNYKPEQPEMESELFSWLRNKEQRKGFITDDILQSKARDICAKRFIEFKASKNWVCKFKYRNGIGLKVLHGEEGSADRQWVSVTKAILPVLLHGTSTEDIWNGDETGYFFRAYPSTSLASRCRKGMKVAKDRITAMLCCNAE